MATEAEIDNAVARLRALEAEAKAKGKQFDLEQGMDALAQIGLVESKVQPNGEKAYKMKPEVAKVIQKLAEEEG